VIWVVRYILIIKVIRVVGLLEFIRVILVIKVIRVVRPNKFIRVFGVIRVIRVFDTCRFFLADLYQIINGIYSNKYLSKYKNPQIT
jgi:hypothetical protein